MARTARIGGGERRFAALLVACAAVLPQIVRWASACDPGQPPGQAPIAAELDRSATPAIGSELSAAAIAQRVVELRREFTEPAWHVTAEPPWIVVIANPESSQPADLLPQRALGTLRWARRQLQRELLPREPQHAVELFVTSDQATYQRLARTRWAIEPPSPFGFFSAQHQGIMVNVQDGTGSLVHELVHALVAANYPHCPAWLNEGLASLYEHCAERDGKIWGLPNWRLRRLQRHVRDHQPRPSLLELIALTDAQFYAHDPSLNVAVARYLCMYLQQHGQLEPFFTQAAAGGQRDPADSAALLRAALPAATDADRQRDWDAYVLSLTE